MEEESSAKARTPDKYQVVQEVEAVRDSPEESHHAPIQTSIHLQIKAIEQNAQQYPSADSSAQSISVRELMRD